MNTMNSFEIDTLQSVITNAANIAYDDAEVQVIQKDTNSPGWRIVSAEAPDTNVGLFVGVDGVFGAEGAEYKEIQEQLGLDANGIPV